MVTQRGSGPLIVLLQFYELLDALNALQMWNRLCPCQSVCPAGGDWFRHFELSGPYGFYFLAVI